ISGNDYVLPNQLSTFGEVALDIGGFCGAFRDGPLGGRFSCFWHWMAHRGTGSEPIVLFTCRPTNFLGKHQKRKDLQEKAIEVATKLAPIWHGSVRLCSRHN